MNTGTLVRCGVLALCMAAVAACGSRPAPVAGPATSQVATEQAPVRKPATQRELARYTERQRQASGLEEFEGGRRAQNSTIIIVLLVVIIVLLVL